MLLQAAGQQADGPQQAVQANACGKPDFHALLLLLLLFLLLQAAGQQADGPHQAVQARQPRIR
jgi:hypothetical protein